MSPLGFDFDDNVINAADSAEIYAYLFDPREQLIPQDSILSVEFTVQHPDPTTSVTASGDVVGDGKAFLRYLDTEEIGEYKVIATFNLDTGAIRSTRADFEVIDPFNPPDPEDADVIGMLVWQRIEDLFDSEEGGPWVQDVTKATFKKEKMDDFLAQGLFDINNQTPPTAAGLEEFITAGVPQPDAPLLVQGTMIAVIRHLMRAYVEQPLPTGASVAYEDRRDYLQRWQLILQEEEQYYMRLLLLWKRQFLHLGSAKTLVSSKAGRLIPAPMRTRNVGRGYW